MVKIDVPEPPNVAKAIPTPTAIVSYFGDIATSAISYIPAVGPTIALVWDFIPWEPIIAAEKDIVNKVLDEVPTKVAESLPGPPKAPDPPSPKESEDIAAALHAPPGPKEIVEDAEPVEKSTWINTVADTVLSAYNTVTSSKMYDKIEKEARDRLEFNKGELQNMSPPEVNQIMGMATQLKDRFPLPPENMMPPKAMNLKDMNITLPRPPRMPGR